MAYDKGPVVERFYLRVKKGPGHCLLWTGTKNKWGYGVLMIKGKYSLAHRVAWEIVTGKPPDGLVCHTCDTPGCVRFAHLFLGTIQSNMADRQAKERQARGEKGGNAKLLNVEVIAIKERLRQGDTMPHIARAYGVSVATIASIRDGKTWGHIL